MSTRNLACPNCGKAPRFKHCKSPKCDLYACAGCKLIWTARGRVGKWIPNERLA